MVYNEPDFLPVWAAHYCAAVGPENCFVLDHGSDDGSMDAPVPYQVARLPRSPLDEEWRAREVSRVCAFLLDRYEAVAYTDVDELLVADPRRYRSLVELSARMDTDVLTAFGTNMLQVPGDAPIDLSKPISAQRRWTRPFSSLCKPILVRRPVTWLPGFHGADAASRFGGLYLFHIAYVDHAVTARRQAKRQGVERSKGHGAHHGTDPGTMVRLMVDCGRLPQDYTCELGGAAEARFITELLRDGRADFGGRVIVADREPAVLWAVPEWLEGAF
jgi:hypothetical protein